MTHAHTLDAARAALVVIDMQEAFRSSIHEFSETATRIARLIEGVRLLKLPILVTEQYPKGLGRTAREILRALPADVEPIEKTAFSCCGAASFTEQLQQTNARQLLLCGIEAHICVNQTTHDLLERGYQVHLLRDCITARSASNVEIGLQKMQQSGALCSSTELALFELLRDAQHEQFKAVQKLIK